MISARVLGVTADRAPATGRAGWAIAGAALVLGLAGDLLLRTWPWGLNATVWLTCLCAVALVLPQIESLALPRRQSSIWLAAALTFVIMLAWRASPVLQTLNVIAVFLCLGMVAFPTTARALRAAGSSEYAVNVFVNAFHAVVGVWVLIARDLDWRALSAAQRSERFVSIARGIAIASLPLLVFGALFASADVFFRELLTDLVSVDTEEIFSHLVLWGVFGWLAGSYLWGTLLAERVPAPEPPRIQWLRFDFIEAGIVLGLVNALFLVFVAVQFRYLFGGASRVEASSSLTYAEYARRGFFELVTVAALVVPFLLLTHWLLPRQHTRLHRFYSILAGVLVALVFVVMASALERMRLYQETFGLTELRLYTTAFMLWVFAVLAWLVFTVLRDRRERFAFGVTVAGLAVLLGLNALNPDALIVQRNVSITYERPFDTVYALDLSPDSVPALVDNFEKVPARERCSVARVLRRRYLDVNGDWRNWNWGRVRAHDAVSGSVALAEAC